MEKESNIFNLGELACTKNLIKWQKEGTVYTINCKFIANLNKDSVNIKSQFSEDFTTNNEDDIKFRFKLGQNSLSGNLKELILELMFDQPDKINSYIFKAFILDKYLNINNSQMNNSLIFSQYSENILELQYNSNRSHVIKQAYHLKNESTFIIICSIGLELKESILSVTDQESNFNSTDNHFDTYKNLLNDKISSFDVTLKIQNQEIKAHKLILSARSSVFCAQFIKDKNTSVININNVEFQIMKILIRFMYTAEVELLNSDNVIRVLDASNKYKIFGLINECNKILNQNITINNAIETLTFADSHNIDYLKKSAVNLIVKNISKFDDNKLKEISNINPMLLIEITRQISLKNTVN